MSEQSTSTQEASTQPATGEKQDKDDMSTSSLGMIAVIIFVFLLLLFLAGVATTGEFTSTTAPVAAPAAAQPLAAPTNTPAVVTTNGGAGATTYTVQPGDWLAAIARRYNTTVPAILAANPQITDSNTIRPGVTLVIP